MTDFRVMMGPDECIGRDGAVQGKSLFGTLDDEDQLAQHRNLQTQKPDLAMQH